MSSDVAIRVENLGKMYRIGGPQARYSTFRETLTDAFAAPFRRVGRLLRGQGSAADLDRTIWALKDVSFEVKRGEVVGIIGRNGAGKSTLLKILSRITEPTDGAADIYGRVGSLLEVGTGFHPELTGRENIFLNGAILGMRRAEIDRKLDEIVAFAEIETFLDTPVKHYSSGMYVRLAFAVAAHLEPEILLVDEVLSVGDIEFQRKCIGKMNQVSQGGRTVLFVSHSMDAITRLCSRVFLLDQGQVVSSGPAQKTVQKYLSFGAKGDGEITWNNGYANPGVKTVTLNAVRILNSEGSPSSTTSFSESLRVEITFTLHKRFRKLRIGMILTNQVGQVLIHSYQDLTKQEFIQSGEYRTVCVVPSRLLPHGQYFISVILGIQGQQNLIYSEDIISINVHNNSNLTMDYFRGRRPAFDPEIVWNLFQL